MKKELPFKIVIWRLGWLSLEKQKEELAHLLIFLEGEGYETEIKIDTELNQNITINCWKDYDEKDFIIKPLGD